MSLPDISNFSKDEKIKLFLMLIQDPEIHPTVMTFHKMYIKAALQDPATRPDTIEIIEKFIISRSSRRASETISSCTRRV